MTGVRYDSETTPHFSYTYGANGEVAQVVDNVRGVTVRSEHDLANRPMRKTTMQGSTHVYTGTVTYDQYNNVSSFLEQVGSNRSPYVTNYTYDNENHPVQMLYNYAQNIQYGYDALGRIHSRAVDTKNTTIYSVYDYLAGSQANSTTPLVERISQMGGSLTYTYDDAGNITSVNDGSHTVGYVYDMLGQLIRVNDATDAAGGADGSTWIYTYDQGGNMLSKCLYAYTTGTPGTLLACYDYTYNDANWKDKLTAVNNVPISYDTIGNPVSDGTWNYVWDKGRQLKQISRLGEVVQFTYNEDGLRVQKVSVTNGVTKYTLHGKNIVHMTSGGHDLHFFYDAQNRPAIVSLDGVSYVYMYNLQGDVIALLDSLGNLVVYYTYDAWGRITGRHGALANSLGLLNPFRYRGYVYDEETGLYYLRSRYYNPIWCRFINADAILLCSHSIPNIFLYCDNSPIIHCDPNGFRGILDTDIKWSKPFGCSYDDMMTDNDFIAYMMKMVDEKWKYDKKGDEYGMRVKYVDCVSVYRFAMKHYYDRKGYYYYLPRDKKKNELDNVTELVERGVHDLEAIDEEFINVIPGMALFCKDSNGKYTHVAYYIGEGLAIESNVRTKKYPAGVHIINVEDGNFVERALLNGIYYTYYDNLVE